MVKDVCFHCKRSLNKKFRIRHGENIYCGVCYDKLKKDGNIVDKEKKLDNNKCFTCGEEMGVAKFKDKNGYYHCLRCHNKDLIKTDAPKCNSNSNCKCNHSDKPKVKTIEEKAKEHAELQMSKIMRGNVKHCIIETNYSKEWGLRFNIHLERSSQEESGISDVNMLLSQVNSQLAIKEIMEIVFKYSLQEKEATKQHKISILEIQKAAIQETINELKGEK